MFLTPETQFTISVKTETVEKDGLLIPSFEIIEGGSIVMRTATGREFARILSSMRDTDALYSILPTFITSGIDPKRIDDLHPGIVHLLMQEVFKRSRLSEVERGK